MSLHLALGLDYPTLTGLLCFDWAAAFNLCCGVFNLCSTGLDNEAILSDHSESLNSTVATTATTTPMARASVKA